MCLLNLHRCFLLIAAILVLTPTASMAKQYECTTEQALIWKHGKLVPDEYNKHSVFSFYDKDEGSLSNNLSIAKNPDLPAGFFTMEVMQEMTKGNDLVVSSHNTIKGSVAGVQTFRIRSWDVKSDGLVFLYTSDNLIASGECEVTP